MNCQVDEQERKDGGRLPTLKEQDTNLWVARIVQIRRGSKNIWIRVAWYYSPDDLTDGRQPYHGKYEIIRSTLEDIISAEAVADPCQVVHWDEYDDKQRCLDVLLTTDLESKKQSNSLRLPWTEVSRNQDRTASGHTIPCTGVMTARSGNMNNV